MLTSEQYKGDKCPNCESSFGVVGMDLVPVGVDKAYRTVSCDDCDASWTEELTVTGYDELVVPDEETK